MLNSDTFVLILIYGLLIGACVIFPVVLGLVFYWRSRKNRASKSDSQTKLAWRVGGAYFLSGILVTVAVVVVLAIVNGHVPQFITYVGTYGSIALGIWGYYKTKREQR